MSSFDRRSVLLGFLTLGACGFEPVYGVNGQGRSLRGAIRVDDPVTREDFFVLERLEERFGRPNGARYGLKVDLDIDEEGLAISGSNNITRYNVVGVAKYLLRELGTGTEVMRGEVDNFTAYSASSQPVATVSAERDARRRLVVSLADKIAAELLIRANDIQ